MNKSLSKIFLIATCFVLNACAHAYYYKPEISGVGAIHGKGGGVVYSIPPKSPDLKMKLVSLGVSRAPEAPAPMADKISMLQIRMYFFAPQKGAACTPAFMEPGEQSVRISGGQAILPVLVHASAKNPPVIDIACNQKQAIDLFFSLPENSEGAADVQNFSFSWKIHYGQSKSEQQSVRFDRGDSAPEQAAELYPDDPFYPYDVSPVLPPDWIVGPWGAPIPR